MNLRFLKRASLGIAALTLSAHMVGCGNSENFVLTNNAPQAVPIAVDDVVASLGNATLNQSAAEGVLTNDTLNGATIDSFDAISTQGATVVLNADGSFTYTPVVGFTGTDTFTYTLANASGTSTATVTVNVTGEAFFVDNQAQPGGNGSQAQPFNNLAAATAVAQSGDTVFVARGDGTNNNLTGAVNLPTGVDLIGEGTGLIVARTIVPPGQAPVITGPINCGGNNQVSGLTVMGSSGDGLVINNVGDVTVTNCTFDSTAAQFIDCDDSTGAVTITENTFQNPPDGNIDLITIDTMSTICNFVITGNTFTNGGNSDLDDVLIANLAGTSTIDFNFSENVLDGTQADQFERGVTVAAVDTAQVTVNLSDNLFDNFDFSAISMIGTNGSALSGVVSGNVVTNTTSSAMGLVVSNDTLSVSGNTISDSSGDAMIAATTSAGGTVLLSNNIVSDSAGSGISADGSAGNIGLALRNNSITNSGADAAFIQSAGFSDNCFDITGNTFDDDVRFNNLGTGTYSVERRAMGDGGPLEDVNTFTAGGAIYENGTINSVAPGFCGIP